MLKLSKLLFALLLIVGLSSCGNDGDGENNVDELIGTWLLVEMETSVSTSTTIDNETFAVSSAMVGSNYNYTVEFEEESWNTDGSYDVTATSTFNGEAFPAQVYNYTNVSGSGTYTTDENTITVDQSFFDFDVEGVDMTALGEPQSAEFEFNADGQLVISQNQSMEVTESGVTSSVMITSYSVWDAQ